MEKSKLLLNSNYIISKIDNRIYGSFIEHLGRAVYNGIYEPEHPLADEDGFRKDVLELIHEINVPVVRYPGGNFVSGYNWEDGVGPVEKRPTRLELAWNSVETNRFGTDEFIKWCRKANIEPMMAVNLGSRGPTEARQLVEYCNHISGTYYSDMRRSNGFLQPHNIKLWCLGNEMDGEWQIGHKSAVEYGSAANEASKMMKLVDPDIETVICGSSCKSMKTFGEWEAQTLDIAYDSVDYVSLHTYLGNSENDVDNFLAKTVELDSFIDGVVATCDYIKSKKNAKKQMNLSFDEWNVWYHANDIKPQPWEKAPHLFEEEYNYSDLLVIGLMIISLLRHCDRVKIACMAQLVNVIAPITTENGGKAWKQSIFYPYMHASKFGRGTVLNGIFDTSKHDTKDYTDVPNCDCVSILSNDENEITIFAVNRSHEDMLFDIELSDFSDFIPAEHIAISGYGMNTVNDKENERIVPHNEPLPIVDGKLITAKLPPLSWNVLRFKK
jgi:alpha-N-arabinofuranosidase